MNHLVIYHAACLDGFASAWICSFSLEKADFFAGYYGQDPPDVTDKDVVLVDFSYPKDVLLEMANKCKSMLILDHHKTAQEALVDFTHDRVKIVFDMNRSGAGICWDHYYPEARRSLLVKYVEDKDLWVHKLQNSKEINAWIGTIPFTFEAWNAAARVDFHDALQMGKVALAKTDQYVKEVSKNARRIECFGYNVPIVNAPQVDISELLDHLRQGEQFAMGWSQRKDGMFVYSLRSVGDFDVSVIAKHYGGGGHKNAAGFQLDKLIF